MAVKYICDRCGFEEGVGRVTLSMAVSVPHDANILPKLDKDLCAKCLKDVIEMIPKQHVPISRNPTSKQAGSKVR